MSHRNEVPRRTLLGTAVLVFGATVAPGPARRTYAQAQAKVSKAVAKYQDHPNGEQRCAICINFEPPNRCRFVEGDISPTGWCQLFAARENAQ